MRHSHSAARFGGKHRRIRRCHQPARRQPRRVGPALQRRSAPGRRLELGRQSRSDAASVRPSARGGMMRTAPSNLRSKPTAAQVLLLALAALCGTVDLLHNFGGNSLSGMGAATLFACGGAWAMWLARPSLPNDLLKPLLPLVMFDLYACGSMLWYSPGAKGLQLLAVALAFLAIILLTARETDRNPHMAHRLQKMLLYSSAVGVLLYFFAVAKNGLDATGGIVGGRTFALYAMVIVSLGIARWRSGRTVCLFWTAVVVLAVYLSLSRM